jgi:hypothetical protein
MAATLYPLIVPTRPWHTIGLAYLTHLPIRNGFDNVLIVADHLTKMTNFIMPCTETVTTEEIASLFILEVYNILHGLPRVMVSDRDPKFANGLWQRLWRRLGTRLNMSCSRHPKTDGLTKRGNNTFQ